METNIDASSSLVFIGLIWSDDYSSLGPL